MHATVSARAKKTLGKLERLIAEMQLREMHLDGVASFLQSSGTSARNYMQALLDADLVAMPGNQPCRAKRRLYRLHADQDAIARFLDGVQHSDVQPGGPRGGARTHSRPCGFRQVHIPCNASPPGSAPRVIRDPLVAALFGSA